LFFGKANGQGIGAVGHPGKDQVPALGGTVDLAVQLYIKRLMVIGLQVYEMILLGPCGCGGQPHQNYENQLCHAIFILFVWANLNQINQRLFHLPFFLQTGRVRALIFTATKHHL
jgi:hypothetical protein